MVTFYILSSVLVISFISLIGVFTLVLQSSFLHRILFILVGLAAGALIGDALLHLIPEAFENISKPVTVSLLVITGMLVFFMLEKFLLWHHVHGTEDGEEKHIVAEEDKRTHTAKIKPLGVLILCSDAVHNLVDGVIIAASFLISIEVGIATTLAVALHEIPQEIADFGLLIHSGMSNKQALLWNFTSALTAVLGALLLIIFGSFAEQYTFHMGAFAAGAFLYIAGSDLVPEIHKTRDLKKSFLQFISIIIGVLIMLVLVAVG